MNQLQPASTVQRSAHGGLGRAPELEAAEDNTDHRYNVYRSTTSGFTPGTGNSIAQPTGHVLHRAAPPERGTYYYKVTPRTQSNSRR